MFTVEEPLAFVPPPTSVRLRARNAKTGAMLWTRDLAVDPPGFLSPATLQPAVSGGRVLVQVAGKLRALDASTGTTVWSAFADPGEWAWSPAVDGGLVAWLTGANGGGEVRFLDLSSGRLLSRSAPLAAPTGAMALHGGVAYVGTNEPNGDRGGSLIAIARSGGQLWKAWSPYGKVSGIIAADDLVYTGVWYFEGDQYNWNTWAVKARSGAQAFFRVDFLRFGWADAVSADRIYSLAGVLDRWSGNQLPQASFGGPLNTERWSGGGVVANGVVFSTQCTAWVVPFPDYPPDCTASRLQAFSASTGAQLPIPDLVPGGPVVAEGRLYVWSGHDVQMYQPG